MFIAKDPEIKAFQLSCQESDKSICDNCSCYFNCSKKYTLKESNKEFYIELEKVIISFPSRKLYKEFCLAYAIKSELKQNTVEYIHSVCEEKNLELIIYN